MKTCVVCKQKIKENESSSVINENMHYHTNGFCDTVVVERLIDGDGDSQTLNESLNDLSDYEIV